MADHTQTLPDPVRTWTLRKFISDGFRADALAEVPSASWPQWVCYDNTCELRKRTCNRASRLGPALRTLLGMLHLPSTVRMLGDITGITGLAADPRRYGAGLHVTDPGGWLQVHTDHELLPHLPGRERRLSLILCLNSEWQPG